MSVTRPNRMLNMVQPINWLSPLNKGLVAHFLCVPGLMTSNRWIDLVNPGRRSALLSGGATFDAQRGRQGGSGSTFYDGVNDLASQTAFAIPIAKGSLSLWHYPLEQQSGATHPLFHMSATNVEFNLFPFSDGNTYAGWSTIANGDDRVKIITPSAIGAWHHWYLTWVNGGVSELYYDGARVTPTAQPTINATWNTSTATEVSFASSAATYYANCLLDDIRISSEIHNPKFIIEASRLGYQRELNWFRQAGAYWVPIHYTMPAAVGAFAETGIAAVLKSDRKIIGGLGSLSLAGQTATPKATRKLTATVQTYIWTAQAATLRSDHPLTATTVAYVHSGIAAGLRIARKLSATVQTYAETGIAANLKYGHRLVAAVGPLSESGQAAGLRATRILSATVQTYAMAGVAAGLQKGRTLTADVTAFAESGQAATLLHHSKIAANTGTLAETGIAAGLIAARRISATTQTYLVSGIAAGLIRPFTMTAVVRSYAETGNAAGLLFQRKLQAAVGSLIVTGIDASLERGATNQATVGTFAHSGKNANLLFSRKLTAAAGPFTETGVAANLRVNRPLSAATATYIVTTSAAGLRGPFHILTGVFILTGMAAVLQRGQGVSIAHSGLGHGPRISARLVHSPRIRMRLEVAA